MEIGAKESAITVISPSITHPNTGNHDMEGNHDVRTIRGNPVQIKDDEPSFMLYEYKGKDKGMIRLDTDPRDASTAESNV